MSEHLFRDRTSLLVKDMLDVRWNLYFLLSCHFPVTMEYEFRDSVVSLFIIFPSFQRSALLKAYCLWLGRVHDSKVQMDGDNPNFIRRRIVMFDQSWLIDNIKVLLFWKRCPRNGFVTSGLLQSSTFLSPTVASKVKTLFRNRRLLH